VACMSSLQVADFCHTVLKKCSSDSFTNAKNHQFC
jgi:hypothetical protein